MDQLQSEPQTQSQTPVLIRDAVTNDLNLIFSSWLRSYRPSQFAQKISNDVFYKEHHSAIERAIIRSALKVAVNPEDQNHVYGWACFESRGPIPILHYMYVKNPFRGFSIARKLMSEMRPGVFFFTHFTPPFARFSEGGLYSPYLFFPGDQ